MPDNFNLSAAKFTHYIKENEGWQYMLEHQIREFPGMNDLLSTVIKGNCLTADEKACGEIHFKNQLKKQQAAMDALNKEISKQQKRLISQLDNETARANDIEAFCTEDILRERIRDIEKNYIELKTDFMKYMSAVI